MNNKVPTRKVIIMTIVLSFSLFVCMWEIMDKNYWFLILAIPAGIVDWMCLCVLVIRNIKPWPMYIIIITDPDADCYIVTASLSKARERYEKETKNLDSAFFTTGVILAEIDDDVEFGFSAGTPTGTESNPLYGCKIIKYEFKNEM